MKDAQFTIDDLRAFAALSGDHNPIHIDPVAARRTLFGQPVAHGVLLVMAALDRLWYDRPLALSSLRATFAKPIGVGEAVTFSDIHDANRHQISIGVNGTVRTRIAVEFAGVPAPLVSLPRSHASTGLPRVRSFADAVAASGHVPLFLDRELCEALFPAVSRYLPAGQLAELLGTTRLVGMECPGLHSLYSELALEFGPLRSDSMALAYRIVKANERYSKLELAVEGPTALGELVTFVRPAPSSQIAFEKAKTLVAHGEFSGQQALVVGGSRGIGEVTAQLVAAGGGRVHIGYRYGAEDAKRLAADIKTGGGDAAVVELDVLAPPAKWIETIPRPTHLYYFATPSISTNSKTAFSMTSFEQYCTYYVAAFAEILAAYAATPGAMTFVYPSSIFVSQVRVGMAEYAAAKAAGEVLCAFFARKYPQFRIASPRLPRMKTDQTLALSPLAAKDAAEVMLPLLREMGHQPAPGP